MEMKNETSKKTSSEKMPGLTPKELDSVAGGIKNGWTYVFLPYGQFKKIC